MKVQDVMTRNPVCCMPSDKAQAVARTLRDEDVGSVPVVSDLKSRHLEGVITDRDICCKRVAEGLDPKRTSIDKYVSRNPAVCHASDSLDQCEKIMQQRQIRRIPVVDDKGCWIGVVAQADLALKEKADRVHKTVAEISKPSRPAMAA